MDIANVSDSTREIREAAERARAVDTGVRAPVGYTRTESGRRSGAFAIFMAFAVTPEVFDRVGEYLDRKVAEDSAAKVTASTRFHTLTLEEMGEIARARAELGLTAV